MLNTHSTFWSGNFENEVDVLTGKLDSGKDHMKLAATLRAVSNFVNIVTGQSVPVRYKGNDSYTDGKSVTISSNIKDKNFDPTVGLALHEGSHIKLTDFSILTQLESILIAEKIDHTYDHRILLRGILNYVEDRRIDSYIYTNAPGYKPYYKAMYDTYFHSKSIDKGLKSTKYRDEDEESYMFRLINITNSNRDLDALKELRAIWNVLDLGNVDRLKSTTDAMNVAIDVTKIIIAAIAKDTTKTESEGAGEEGEQKGEGGNSGQGGKEQAETPQGDAGSDDGSTAEGESIENTTTPGEFDLSPRDEKLLDNAIEKQKAFNGGKVKKTGMSKSDRSKVDAIKDSSASSKEVGAGANSHYTTYKNSSIDCIIVKKLDKIIIDSGVYDGVLLDPAQTYYRDRAEEQQEFIDKGTRLGIMLGRKLQVRNSDRTLKHNRLRAGKIDRRALASLGFGAEAVFEKIVTTSHNAACLHISIDASGSMSGERWENSQVAAVAIAKAASMTNNMDVVISYRSIFGSFASNGAKPLVLIAYDSRKDPFNKITRLFKWLTPGGSTPAGLCFEAIR